MKSPRAFSSSMKLAKKAVQSPIVYHLVRALHKAKSLLLELLNKNKFFRNRNKKIRRSSLYGSIRWHYNWCSSHVRPLSEPVEADWYTASNPACPDSYSMPEELVVEVEEESHSELGTPPWCYSQRFDVMSIDEINKLAELFIANCHEKFKIEKEESYRMYQEMLARGM